MSNDTDFNMKQFIDSFSRTIDADLTDRQREYKRLIEAEGHEATIVMCQQILESVIEGASLYLCNYRAVVQNNGKHVDSGEFASELADRMREWAEHELGQPMPESPFIRRMNIKDE